MKDKTTGITNSNQGQTAQQEREIQLLKDLLDRVSAHAAGLEKELDGISGETDSLRKSAEYWEHEATQLRLALDELYHSRSWKITLPVRLLSRLIRWLFLLPSRAWRRPGQQVKALGTGQEPDSNPSRQGWSRQQTRNRAEPTELSPRETEIYNELRQVIAKKRMGTDADRN